MCCLNNSFYCLKNITHILTIHFHSHIFSQYLNNITKIIFKKTFFFFNSNKVENINLLMFSEIGCFWSMHSVDCFWSNVGPKERGRFCFAWHMIGLSNHIIKGIIINKKLKKKKRLEICTYIIRTNLDEMKFWYFKL